MNEKTIRLEYLDADCRQVSLTLTGARVGYDPVGDSLVKVWADKRTIIVRQDSVILIDMQD